jgi:hypothetical protein
MNVVRTAGICAHKATAGEGQLGCDLVEASGTLSILGASVKVKFVGTVGVWLVIAEPAFAAGVVSFATDTTDLERCALTSPEGPSQLKFTAVAAGVFG